MCVQYEGSCEGTFHDALDQQQASLTDYLEGKARRYSPFTQSEYAAFGEEVKDSVTEMATRFAQDLKFRVDLASDLFIFYCILGLWFPTPFVVNRSGWQTGVKRNVFGLDKRTFVLAVIFVTFFLDIVRELRNGVNLTLYFYNIASNPCFLDGDFLAARAAAIAQVCKQLRNYSSQVITSNNSVASMYIDIEAYGPEGLPNGCGCDYPGDRTAIDAFVGNNQTGLRPFVGDLAFCSNATAQREVLNPPQAEVNWWTVWFESGVIAELVLKVTLVNLAHAIIGYTDPLALVGGRYEVHRGSKMLPEAAQDEIAVLLSYKHARDIGIWGVIAAISIFNLLWSGVVAVMNADTVEAATEPDGGTGVATMSSSVGGCVDGTSTNYAMKVGLWFFFLACIAIGAAVGGNCFLNKLETNIKTEQREKDLEERRSMLQNATPLSKFRSAVRKQQAATAFALPGSDSTVASRPPPNPLGHTPPRMPGLPVSENEHRGGVSEIDMEEVENPVMPQDSARTRVVNGSSGRTAPPTLSELVSRRSGTVTPPRLPRPAAAQITDVVALQRAARKVSTPRPLPSRPADLVHGSERGVVTVAEGVNGAASQALPPRVAPRPVPARRAPPPQLPPRVPNRS